MNPNPDFLKQFEATNWKDGVDIEAEPVIIEPNKEQPHG